MCNIVSISSCLNTDGICLQEDADYNLCADRWKNMKDDAVKRVWAIFNETGIFLALCHHGFALVIADMVQSGELYVAIYILCSFLLTLSFQSKISPCHCG